MASSNTRRRRIVQNFYLVWLDGNIDEVKNDDCHKSITQLRQVVNTVNTFVDVDECIEFINGIKEEKAFIISSGALSQTIVPVIHDKPQVNTIYIFCGNKARHEKWAKDWRKIKGVYTNIDPICRAIKEAKKNCDHNSISMSFVKKTTGTSKQDLDTLDSSFMYTQILKEILLTIDFEQVHIHEFLAYCREQFVGNNVELRNVEKIEKEYRHHQPIWWYTYDCFLYSMLNRALRLMEVDLIIKLGFFLKDLHNDIHALHSKQFVESHHSHSFVVYRGQGLSQTDFDELAGAQGGLLSFNNFLSTSKNCDVSLDFARRTMQTSDLIGVFFVIEVDPSISATSFANITDVSSYKEEEEILFSMHSVFRIGQVKQIDGNKRLWQVDLALTNDKDPQLLSLTERIQEETAGSTGWLRLGKLLVKVAEYSKAEDLYNTLLPITTDEREQGNIYYQLGYVKADRGQYTEAIKFYEKSLVLREKVLTLEHPEVAECFNDIGWVYNKIGEHSKALSYYEKVFEIFEKTLPANHPDLATTYNNIGCVYKKIEEYSKALSYFGKALEIYQKSLPANHPNLSVSYNNIGWMYSNMGEHSKALSYYEKAHEIRQKSLPANHPDLATTYNNIGCVYKDMEEYSKALSYYGKALEIYQKSLPANHPNLSVSYNNIGWVYNNMGEYSQALSYYEKVLEIRQKSLPANHPDIKTVESNIEFLKKKL